MAHKSYGWKGMQCPTLFAWIVMHLNNLNGNKYIMFVQKTLLGIFQTNCLAIPEKRWLVGC